ncbi:amino acid permease [Rhodococcus erythropolis]|jgi:GABA permease|uniref:GABA permease n=1 Tax=Rhodococcus erythropolis TaxID=1833 RepID=A0A0C2ZPJ3_RHOER|nr:MULTISPECIES: amino acid permease [Rhodococcus]AGT95126.1 gamma-aminobutyrate permease [Rhodococcus erythropolis CCM2595]ATI31000.1 amino acid permease [Rhodococcus sp. H-CA8f]KAB2584505.1 GABA permease [Rhodococcus erythropolis]KIM14770.1 GABA permease [Rhodococcus erythropolis]MBF7733238.1 amino acid permease [Rhodococcus erythropolis]
MPDSSTETAEAASVHSTLKTGLKKRHLTMLSMGGVIGAGFFVGLSGIINQAGPGAVITCAICGIIVFLVMRMLGEMAVAKPCTGSFTEYARMALGDWAGFTTGWLYWYFWVIVVGIESVVGATLLSRWIHGVPLWLMSAALLLVMTGVNLLSVSNFGEAEYWFAGIKVAVIIGFIVLGSLFVFGIWPGSEVDFSNLTGHGGFLPNGFTPVLVGVVAVIFSMTGAELVTIAAAESAEPAGAIRRATNTVVFRILAFFVVATFLLVTMLPWDSFVVGDSPFISALDLLGIPGAADILNLVVLVAVLSCLNSGLYTASRMLFALSVYNDAPAWMTRTNSRGVPVKGVLACTVAGYFCIAAGYIWPDTIFLFLVNSSGAICLFVYILICVSELRLRRRWERESPEILKFRVWLYPGLPIVVTGLILVILVGMGLNEPTRAEFVQSLVALGVILVAYSVRRSRTRKVVSFATASNNAHSSSKKA